MQATNLSDNTLSASSSARKPHSYWYKDVLIYEVAVKSFYDSNNDGYGDFPGLTQKLDYIQDLGINCLWLLPFYPSPLRDDGYDIADYMTINPVYGTMDDFKTFIEEAHKRDIKVITELVVNHTSDQHPWFQAARNAPAGSPERDFYVWSDSDEKYGDTRIIFTDTEKSNWTWDPVAKAYYWHRFFHHQPDLNFDNPAVLDAIIEVMRFWLDMGVDGFRLDAIPYLIEREGTNCENLPETHTVIKKLRAALDERYDERLFLAEANQWPTDVREYFGDADECHMAYHFPVMPRLYMAVHQEDRHPISEIMRNTPEIPESCQWAIFLRNHDELTLEMVTDEERDYMYNAYAADPRMRINVGIRRRLAPLLENNRRCIELLNNLLFALPGTPIIYYGDELGMGDNIFLGDRNGVRTPMQWNADRNSGFSKADFASLYAQPIMDPVYGFQAVNVESQQRNPSSLLNWMKQIIGIRKNYKAFGRGSIEFLFPENRKILAFIRRYEDEIILVVSNLSRLSQPIALDLSAYKGYTPIEMFGLVEFPPIGEAPYVLTLAPYFFHWFRLQETPALLPLTSATKTQSEAVDIPSYKLELERGLERGWSSLLPGEFRKTLEAEIIPRYLGNNQTWRNIREQNDATSASGHLKSATISDWINLTESGNFLLWVTLEYEGGASETLQLPVAVLPERAAESLIQNKPEAILAKIHVLHLEEDCYLVDGLEDDAFCHQLLSLLKTKSDDTTHCGVLHKTHTASFDTAEKDDRETFTLVRNELAKGAVDLRFGEKYQILFFRKPGTGLYPVFETGSRLATQNQFGNFQKTYGLASYQPAGGKDTPLITGVLKEYFFHQGDGWQYSLDELRRFYERVSTHMHLLEKARAGDLSLVQLLEQGLPDEAYELLGIYIREASVLGKRTGEMHLGLSSLHQDSNYAPEKYDSKDLSGFISHTEKTVESAYAALEKDISQYTEPVQKTFAALLKEKSAILKQLKRAEKAKSNIVKLQCHNNYSLNQVLWVKGNFIIQNIGGPESGGASTEMFSDRLPAKKPVLTDIASMLRSFSYATMVGLYAHAHSRPDEIQRDLTWAMLCQKWISTAFLKEYLETVQGDKLTPASLEDFFTLLDGFIIEKSFSDILYQHQHQPEWLELALNTTLYTLDMKPRA